MISSWMNAHCDLFLIERNQFIIISEFYQWFKLKVTSATKQQLLKMSHLKHRLRIFLFHRKIMFHFQDIQVFVFLTIPWFTKSVTSRWVLAHESRCILNISFEPQIMKSPSLASWQIQASTITFNNLLNNLGDWG